MCFKSREKRGRTDGENGDDDSVDPTCVEGEKVKDQGIDEAHRKK